MNKGDEKIKVNELNKREVEEWKRELYLMTHRMLVMV